MNWSLGVLLFYVFGHYSTEKALNILFQLTFPSTSAINQRGEITVMALVPLNLSIFLLRENDLLHPQAKPNNSEYPVKLKLT